MRDMAGIGGFSCSNVQIYFFVTADAVVNRRLHPASVWSGLFSIGLFQLSVQLVESDFWIPFVDKFFS
jgi:hypothetical protein